jgi:hypothetical protein
MDSMHDMDVEVVIARYREDPSWIPPLVAEFPSAHFFVYEKDPDLEEGSLPYRGCPNVTITRLPNVGRESHTFLTHIVRCYDTRPPGPHRRRLALFLQGNPFDHGVTICRLRSLLESGTRGATCVPCSSHPGLKDDAYGFPHHAWLPVGELFSVVFPEQPVPSSFHFSPGAQYAVDWAAAIAIRPKDFWSHLLQRSAIDASFPWAVERLWPLLFRQ